MSIPSGLSNCTNLLSYFPVSARATGNYIRVCVSKKGRISAVVALKSVIPPSRPKVDGQECPRHFTVNPLTTASLFKAEQMDWSSVVLLCGLEVITLIPSLTNNAMSHKFEGNHKFIKTDEEPAEHLGAPQPLRIAHASRYCVMLGVASK
jgi:hypothetical protein